MPFPMIQRPSRETIMAALETAVFGCYAWATTGRRLLHWSEVQEQPAVFIRTMRDQVERQEILAALTIHCELWIYAKSTPEAPGGVVLNGLTDAVEGAFAPDPSFGTCTLGGVVQHAWIEGEIEYDPGDLDTQAIAIVPVRILVP